MLARHPLIWVARCGDGAISAVARDEHAHEGSDDVPISQAAGSAASRWSASSLAGISPTGSKSEGLQVGFQALCRPARILRMLLDDAAASPLNSALSTKSGNPGRDPNQAGPCRRLVDAPLGLSAISLRIRPMISSHRQEEASFAFQSPAGGVAFDQAASHGGRMGQLAEGKSNSRPRGWKTGAYGSATVNRSPMIHGRSANIASISWR